MHPPRWAPPPPGPVDACAATGTCVDTACGCERGARPPPGLPRERRAGDAAARARSHSAPVGGCGRAAAASMRADGQTNGQDRRSPPRQK